MINHTVVCTAPPSITTATTTPTADHYPSRVLRSPSPSCSVTVLTSHHYYYYCCCYFRRRRTYYTTAGVVGEVGAAALKHRRRIISIPLIPSDDEQKNSRRYSHPRPAIRRPFWTFITTEKKSIKHALFFFLYFQSECLPSQALDRRQRLSSGHRRLPVGRDSDARRLRGRRFCPNHVVFCGT